MPPRPLRDCAIAIVHRLRQHGHVAYFAGGCVRDMLLGLTPKDYDITTDAQPPRIIELFTRTRKVGVQFGVVLVKQAQHWIEVATFRTEVSYSDGRHPDRVEFATAEEDAHRRDFTINGMFYDPIDEKVIDYVAGQQDLDARTLRAIGEPQQRFAEDHLRVLRAVRFAATYDCAIEPTTWQATRDMAHTIETVSAERIREELEKCFIGPQRSRAFRLIAESGLLAHLWPNADWSAGQIAHAQAVVDALPGDADFALTLAAILIDRDVAEANRVCRALRCSNATREQVAWLIANRDVPAGAAELTLADLKLLMQSPHFNDLLTFVAAIYRGEGRSLDPCDAFAERTAAIPEDEIAPPPLINGYELKALGLPEGPTFKRVLDQVYYAQLNNDISTKAQALALVKDLTKTHES